MPDESFKVAPPLFHIQFKIIYSTNFNLIIIFFNTFVNRQGSRSKVQGSRFKVQGSRFKVQGPRFKVQGSRFKVQGSRSKVQGVRRKIGVTFFAAYAK
jgi:hypothetical protein